MKYNFALLGALASTVTAHSWIEQLVVIDSNGTMTGAPGFARGNVLRSSPGFSDPTMVNLIPPDGRQINQIFPTDLMCKSTQTVQNQTQGSPRLQASAGDNIALRYQENGHVTLPQNQPGKPDNRGTIFVYGTTQPQENDAFLSIHRVWNAAGTGGDRRGVLLSTQNFDDSQCYQVNGGQISQTRQKQFPHVANQLMGADIWCQQDIQIPATAPTGKPYTLYWVWDWPTLPGTPGFPEGKQEIYTTCMDVDVTAGSQEGGSGGSSNVAANNFIVGQSFNSAGVQSELAVVANPTAVTGQFIPFSSASGTPGPTDTSGKVSASSQVSTSLQSSGFSSYLTENPASTPAAAETSAAAAEPSANAAATTHTRHHHSRPSVSPIGSPNAAPSSDGNPGNGNNNGNDNNDNGNNGPAAAASNSINNPNINTATAISQPAADTTPPPAPTPAVGNANNNNNDACPSIVTQFSSIFQTITQTKLETVFVSNTAGQGQGQKRAEATPAVKRRGTCSKRQAAYKLKARRPFIIVPGVDAIEEEC